jgi:hypothetical protein
MTHDATERLRTVIVGRACRQTLGPSLLFVATSKFGHKKLVLTVGWAPENEVDLRKGRDNHLGFANII